MQLEIIEINKGKWLDNFNKHHKNHIVSQTQTINYPQTWQLE